MCHKISILVSHTQLGIIYHLSSFLFLGLIFLILFIII
jgi:hypothetical protein